MAILSGALRRVRDAYNEELRNHNGVPILSGNSKPSKLQERSAKNSRITFVSVIGLAIVFGCKTSLDANS